MLNFLRSKSDTIILKSFSVKPDENTILDIQGERIGLIKWLMSKLGLSDPSYSLVVTKDYFCTIAGQTKIYLPFKELHDFLGGYKTKKLFLFLALLGAFITVIGFLGGLFDGSLGGAIILLIFGGGISFLFYWLYKNSGQMFIAFNTFNGNNITLNMKGGKLSLQGGETVTYEQVQDVLSEIIEHAKSKSKYYN
jgi:hypothetical protein